MCFDHPTSEPVELAMASLACIYSATHNYPEREANKKETDRQTDT